MQTIKQSDNFTLTKDYFGLLHDDGEGTLIYGFENISEPRPDGAILLDSEGGLFGYVDKGLVLVQDEGLTIIVEAGFWFSTRGNARIKPIVNPEHKHYRFALWQRQGYRGNLMTGLVEPQGKLNYIDGCKDTMLHSPIKLGDPCLNALYMPSGVNQTQHTHPSTRSGFIIKGGARCETPEGTFDLEAGEIFYLKTNGKHKFRSDHAEHIEMKLVAYHPDSDFGPTDEVHPMINRTIVDGKSATEIKEIHTK